MGNYSPSAGSVVVSAFKYGSRVKRRKRKALSEYEGATVSLTGGGGVPGLLASRTFCTGKKPGSSSQGVLGHPPENHLLSILF